MALQFQLERSQWLKPGEVEWQQARLAHRIFAHAVQSIPFYQEHYADSGITADTLRDADTWRRLPLLKREHVQAHFQRLQCSVPEHGQTATTATSGSSGSPLVTVGTAVTRILWHAFTLRYHFWHGRDFSGKFATIRSIKDAENNIGNEQRSDDWGGGTIDVVKTGPMVALDIHVPLDEQAEWLLREDPDYLLTYPSVAAALMDHMHRHGQRLTNLKELRTFGELVDPQLRQTCREKWNVPLVDGYSSQEVGYIAIQCPETEEYHVQAESVLVEVLHDDGQPCQPGETGRVVVTTLQNFTMPLIRYEIGDYAEVGDKCPCGRGLPALRRIVGRQRNMAVLPDGRVIWPCMSGELMRAESLVAFPPVQQFQVVQTEPDAVEVRLVMPRPLAEEEVPMIHALVHSSFEWTMRVTIKNVPKIERGPGGKFEDYRCDIPAATIERLKAERRLYVDSQL